MHFFPPSLALWSGQHESLPSPQWLVSHARFGYESFFILSGYFIAHSFSGESNSYLSTPMFLWRRLTRLAIPYWIALLVVGVGWYWLSALLRNIQPFVSLMEAAPAIFFIQDLTQTSSASYALWFMAPLMQFNLLWVLGFWLLRNRRLRSGTQDFHQAALRSLFKICSVAYIGSVIVTAIWGEQRWQLVNSAQFMILGCVIFRASAGRMHRGWIWAMIGVELALAFWSRESHPAAAAVTAGLLYLTSGRRITAAKWLSPLLYVGQRSYSIYLTHTFIGHRVINLLNARLPDSLAVSTTLGIWIGAILASVAFGCLFYALIEQPAIRLSRQVQYRV
jgi:peptidoglycan/LPS O-acetylase OafA/YrhL